MNVTRKEIEYKVDDMIVYINKIESAMKDSQSAIAAINPFKLFEALQVARSVIVEAMEQIGETMELVEAEQNARIAMHAALAAEADYLMPIKQDAQRIA